MPMRDVTMLPKGTKGRKPSAKTLKTKATVLHSIVVRARAGYRCQRCHKTDGRMECAHIFGRRYAATRTDEANAWCLCSGCHRFLTENPLEHVEFAHATVGRDRFLALRDKAYAGRGSTMSASFWAGEVARLEVLAKEHGA